MAIIKGIFGWASNFEDRFIPDHDQLAKLVDHFKGIGLKIVLTSGGFDLKHIGHEDYLERAREHGDLLIVGVDDDEKIRQRKGPKRPAVPQEERLRSLAHVRAVDVLTLKGVEDPKWHLIKLIRPDVLIGTDEPGSYTEEEIKELEAKYCERVIKLPRMAETTTSARIRQVQLGGIQDLADTIKPRVERFVSDLTESIDEAMRGEG